MKRLAAILAALAVCLVFGHSLSAQPPVEQIYLTGLNPSLIRGFQFDGSAFVPADLDPRSSATTVSASLDLSSLTITDSYYLAANLFRGLTVAIVDRATGVELPRPNTTQVTSSETAASPDGQFAYVIGTALSGGRTLIVIDLRASSPTFGTQIGSVTLEGSVAGLAVEAGVGKVFVSRFITGSGISLTTIDVSDPTAPSVIFDMLATNPLEERVARMHTFTSGPDRFLFVVMRSAQIYQIAADGSLSFVQALNLTPATTRVRDIQFGQDASGDHAFALVTSTAVPVGTHVQAIDMTRTGATFNGNVINTATVNADTTTIGEIALSEDGNYLYMRGVRTGTALPSLPKLVALSRTALLTSPGSAVLAELVVDSIVGMAVGTSVVPTATSPTIGGVAVDGVAGAILVNDQPRTITVTGSNLAGVTQASIGLIRATVIGASATSVTITAPALVPAATAPLLLIGSDGSAATSITIANRPTYLPSFVLYASSFSANEIWVLNAATKSEVARHFATGPGPSDAVPTSDGRLLVVADFRGSTATVHSLVNDAVTGAVADERLVDIPVGDGPQRAVVSPVRLRAYVASLDGFLSVIDTDRMAGTYLQVLSTLSLPASSGARSLAVTPDGRYLFIGAGQNPFLLIVNVEDDGLVPGDLTTFSLPDGPSLFSRTDGLAVSPDGQRLYFMTSGETVLRIFDISAPNAPVQIAAVPQPGGILGDVRRIQALPDGRFVYVSSRTKGAVDVFDPTLGAFVTTISTGGYSGEPAVSPQSDYVFVAVGETDQVLTIDARATVNGTPNPAFHTVIAATGAGVGTVSVSVAPGLETEAGTDVTIEPVPDVVLTFSEVTTAGNTTVTSGNVSDLPLPPGFVIAGLPVFFDVRTTATFTGLVTICLPYDPTGLTPADEAALRLLHEEDGTFVDRTVGAPDLVNHRICGEVSSFSQLVVAVAGATITGTVINASTLAPVAGVEVTFYSSTGVSLSSVVTDAQGVYTSPGLLTASYFVGAFPSIPSGLVGQVYDGVPCPGGSCTVTSGTAVAVTVPDATTNINFALPVLPAAFGRVSPAHTAMVLLSSVTLSWSASSDATSYEYCIDTSNNNTCDASWVSVGTATSVGLTELTAYTPYFWHVRSVNADGTTYADGSATTFWSFIRPRPPEVDLNGDGSGDVFTYDTVTGAWSRQVSEPDGGLVEQQLGGWAPGWTVVPSHFNADALTDFFLSNATTGQWFKLLNDGTAFTTESTGDWWPGWQKFVLDLDGDGISDVFLYDPVTGQWYKCVSTPTGFTYATSWWNPDWEITLMHLNGDAFGDLFLIDRSTGRWFWVYGEAGDGFTYPQVGYWVPDWALYPGDFNGDGLGDLFLYRPDAGEYYVALNNGAGYDYTAGYGWAPGWTPYVGDFDGDSAEDLFLYNATTGAWFEMISDGAGGFTAGGNQTWTTGWQLYPTDLHGDGRTDFVLYDPVSGFWYQARNLVLGSFDYSSGFWAPGLTIITRAPIR